MLGDVAGIDVLELGCGAAEWSRALARAPARAPSGSTTRPPGSSTRAGGERGGRLDVPLLHASAEAVPLADGSFDVVMCRLGRDDVRRPVPHRAGSGAPAPARRPARLQRRLDALVGRVRRERGCVHRAARRAATSACTGSRRPEGSVEFNLAYGEWIRLFREHGLVVEDAARDPAARGRRLDLPRRRRRPPGRGAGRWSRSGRRARRERAAGGAARARLHEPAATGDPRAARLSLRRRRARLRRARPARRGCRRARARARPRQGGVGRGAGGRPARARRRHGGLARRPGVRQAGRRDRGGGDARGAGRARRTSSSPASACSRPAGRSSSTRRRASASAS